MPDTRKLLNTFFNPLALKSSDYYSLTKGEDTLTDALGHAGAMAIGYGGTAALARMLMNDIKRRDTEKLRRRLKSHIAATHPTMSLDADLSDDELEARISDMGLAKESTFTMPDWMGGAAGESHWAHLASLLAAAGLGTYAGYRGAGKAYDVAEKKDLDKRVQKLRNEIDKQLTEEYQATRAPEGGMTALDKRANFWAESFTVMGSDKEAGWPDLAGVGPSMAWEGIKKLWTAGKAKVKELGGEAKGALVGEGKKTVDPQGNVRTEVRPGDKALHGAGSLYALYALISGALAYNMARKHSDKTDPTRRELKKIEDYARRQAISRRPPQFLDITGGKLDTVIDPPMQAKRKQIQSVSMDTPQEAAPPQRPMVTDKTDPVAALLGA